MAIQSRSSGWQNTSQKFEEQFTIDVNPAIQLPDKG